MKEKILALILVLSLSGVAQTFSKQVWSNAGGVLKTDAITMRFSIGQPITGPIANTQQLGQGFWYTALATTLTLEPIVSKQEDVLTYPNPVKEELHVRVSFSAPYRIVLYDIKGALVYEKRDITVQDFKMDTSALQEGMYILKLHTKLKQRTLKILKH